MAVQVTCHRPHLTVLCCPSHGVLRHRLLRLMRTGLREPNHLLYVARLERTATHCTPASSVSASASAASPSVHPVAHCAGKMFSTDGGDTWANEVDDGELRDPRCKSTVARMPDRTHAPPFTSPGVVHVGSDSNNESQRVNITVKFSNDSGASWGFMEPVVVLPALDVRASLGRI